MHLVWSTDIHLDFLPEGGSKIFGQSIREDYPNVDAVVVTGDLAQCANFAALIEEFAEGVDKPVWFVLGNHDAYHGSLHSMKTKASRMNGRARWLVKERLVELAPGVALVGTDGWYDGRLGDVAHSTVLTYDFVAIREFQGLGPQGLLRKIAEIADLAAQEATVLLNEAIQKGYRQIIFATHVPPFAMAAWHKGQMGNKNWLPWTSSKAMGEALDAVANANTEVSFTVLCGHTHSPGKYTRSLNHVVLTGQAQYYHPQVSGDFVF